MTKINRFLLGLVLLLAATSAYGVDVISPTYYFSDSVAGQKLIIQGTFTDPGNRKVEFVDISNPAATPRSVDATPSEKGDSLSFFLPNDLKDGRYNVIVRLEGGAPLAVPGELRIPKPPELQVAVTAVRPLSPYPNPAHAEKYDFEIAGTNFASTLANNHVEIDGVPQQVAYAPCGKDYTLPCLSAEAGSETRKLKVEGYSPPGYSRPLAVSVRVGNGTNVAKAPDPLVVSSISQRTLRLYAFGAFAALLGIVFALVRAGVRLGKINGEKYGSLNAFLLDKETNSYSLSKFQLTLFTLVTIFGYIYVFVCQLFVQWKFELPPIPENLPGMMAVSLGTTVVAAGITAKIGGKGAGPASPSPADFITSGGVVLPERFQFFLWTIVSSVGVLLLILASDPVTLTQLPKLPDGMLYLMGLSSAGYLGGKLVRGPGPSIKSIDVTKAKEGVGLVFTLAGENLSVDATYQIDDEHIPAAQVSVFPVDPQSPDPKLCNTLRVTIRDVAERYFDGEHLFRIVNPDSQGADFRYGARIDSVGAAKDLVGQVTSGKLRVSGSNFKDPSSASWTPEGSDVPDDLGVAAVTKKSDTELELTLTPGIQGKGQLTITGPGGLSTSYAVDVPKESEAPGPLVPDADTPRNPDEIVVPETATPAAKLAPAKSETPETAPAAETPEKESEEGGSEPLEPEVPGVNDQ